MQLFLEQLHFLHFLELAAAGAGSYYLYKTKDRSFIRYFVWFLWITVLVELISTYAGIAYFSDYEIFGFVKNTPFQRNYWIYNIYSIYAFSVYISLFASQLRKEKERRLISYGLLVYIFASILNLIFSDVYFVAHSIFTFFAGTIMVVLSIGFFYYQLLRSNAILKIKFPLPFYISIGALVYHLGFVPLVIYSRYFHNSSPDFVDLYLIVLYGINYFLYSLYILGFFICSKKKKSSLLPT